MTFAIEWRQCENCTRWSWPIQRYESRPSHSGEHSLKYDGCEYCCPWSSFLARYKLTHSSERPFKCDNCEYCCSWCSTLANYKLPTMANVLSRVTAVSTALLRVVSWPDTRLVEGDAEVLTIQLYWPILKVKVNHNSVVKNFKTESLCISLYVSIYAVISSLKCRWLLSCSCRFASICMAPVVELLLLPNFHRIDDNMTGNKKCHIGWPWKCSLRLPFTKIISQLLCDWF